MTKKHTSPETVEHRLKRIEAKLTQLLLHMGLDPYNKIYYTTNTQRTQKEVHENDRYK